MDVLPALPLSKTHPVISVVERHHPPDPATQGFAQHHGGTRRKPQDDIMVHEQRLQ